MEIVGNRALRLRLRHPNKVTTVIPKSKQIDDHEVLVNWGTDETRVLNNLGIKVPPPILGRYEWTGKYKPFDHQKKTASFLTMNRKAFCFNEQGTGKTASAIWASDYLLNERIIRRVLILCPLSIMDSAWRNDLFTFAMHRKVGVAYGSAKKRREILTQDSEYIIMNYDGLNTLKNDIKEGDFDLIIVDEASHYKNPSTQRWKLLNKIVGPDTWLWMMTGTPAAQSPMDAFGIAKLVNPTAVPRYMSSFREQVMFKITQFKWSPRENATDIVHRALQPAIRFTKEECLDLPDMTYTYRDTPLTKQQHKYYEELRKKMVMQAQGEEVTSANAAVNLSKLLQISCGAVYTDNKDVLEFDISSKYTALREVIDESSQKVLIFVPFKHTIKILTDKLTADGISNDTISGDVKASARTDIFDRFQKQPDPRVLVIQPQSAAHGITLTAANTIVWWGPTSSLEIYAQANARVHRSGQKHPCTVVQLQGSNAEKHLYNMLDKRIDAHTKIIDLYKQILE